jgi:hypothetical protein
VWQLIIQRSKPPLSKELKIIFHFFTLGFFTVSSTLKIRQAASVAAFIALIWVEDLNHIQVSRQK